MCKSFIQPKQNYDESRTINNEKITGVANLAMTIMHFTDVILNMHLDNRNGNEEDALMKREGGRGRNAQGMVMKKVFLGELIYWEWGNIKNRVVLKLPFYPLHKEMIFISNNNYY